jgi:uncharacterized Zn finger protein
MAEMRTLACPQCQSDNQPRTVLDGAEEYRCKQCGLVYYGPCGCDTVHDMDVALTAVAAAELQGDWATSLPARQVENGAGASARPGGC